MSFEPQNEMGVIILFASMMQAAGWKIIEIGAAFPDASLSKNGETWKTEFEYRASNFLTHRHDVRECDLVICWENDYPDCPLPVLELKDSNWINKEIRKGNPLLNEIEYWRQKALKAEKQLSVLRDRISSHSKPEPQQVIKLDRVNKIQHRRNMIFQHIKMHGDPGASVLGEQFGVDRGTIYRDLDALVNDGSIYKNGDGGYHIKN